MEENKDIKMTQELRQAVADIKVAILQGQYEACKGVVSLIARTAVASSTTDSIVMPIYTSAFAPTLSSSGEVLMRSVVSKV